jgi:hypothetical protein
VIISDEGLEGAHVNVFRMSFAKTTEEEGEPDDFCFSAELAAEEKMEQAPLGSKAKGTSHIALETTADGEADADSGQSLQPTNRCALEDHKQQLKQLKQRNGQCSMSVGSWNQTDGHFPHSTTQLGVEERKITRVASWRRFSWSEQPDALVSEDRINHIFLQADTAGTGFIHEDDVADCIESTESRTQKERTCCTCRSILVSRSFWRCMSFAMGSTSNTTTNLREGEHGHLHGESHSCWQVGSWACLVGCLGFLLLDYDLENVAFRRIQSMNQKLVRWIRRGAHALKSNIHAIIWKLQTKLTFFCRFASHAR